MSTVGSSGDGGYLNYKRAIDDLQEDFKTQTQKSKRNSQKAIENLEKKQQAALRRKDEAAERAIADTKETAGETLTRERSSSKLELEKMKAQNYDRFGKKGIEADHTRQQLEQMNAAVQTQEESLRDQMKRHEDSMSEKVRDLESRHAADKEKLLTDTRQKMQQNAEENQDRNTEINRAFLKEKGERYQRLSSENSSQTMANKRNAQKAIEETEFATARRLASAETAHQGKLKAQEESSEEALARAAEMTSRSRATETREIKDSLMAYQDQEAKQKAAVAQKRVDAMKEHEHEFRTQLQAVQSNSERELAKKKDQIAHMESTTADRQAKNLREQGDHFAKLAGESNQRQEERVQDLQRAFELSSKSTRDEVLKERERNGNSEAVRKERYAAQMHGALDSQAKTYQGTLERVHKEDNDKIDALQKYVTELNTTDEVALISPAAESAIRKVVTQKYEETLAAERERNAASHDSLKRTMGQRLNETSAESAARQAKLTREHALEQHQTRSQLTNTVKDTQMNRDIALQERDAAHEKELEATLRNSAEAMNLMRRRYEDLLAAQKDESRSKIATLRQEAEFESKMTQRAFSSRHNELIRDYEKKLSDQKTLLGSEIKDLKAQSVSAIRETERKNKSALDEQARSYEQRIAQLELQHKEHERVLNRNHEEELEKVKRSNALLISKKS